MMSNMENMENETRSLFDAETSGKIWGYLIDGVYHCAAGARLRLGMASSLILKDLIENGTSPVLNKEAARQYPRCYVHGDTASCPVVQADWRMGE